ncbi:MAG: hypothetical protein M1820_009491 [Bogoriella megaspora]|nr:MAG: hypothetical protein M1820_009491 [Bogoriella megaspora]
MSPAISTNAYTTSAINGLAGSSLDPKPKMAGVLLTSLVCVVGAAVLSTLWKWRQNYKIALKTGFPVFYSPIHISDPLWVVLSPMLVPVLEFLPQAWTSPWLSHAQIFKVWKTGYKPFEEVGSDNIMLATPFGNMLWSADQTLIHQLFTLHPKIEEPVELVKFYDIWGPTVSSVDGDEWKAHRRAVTAGFGSAMNNRVWQEAQRQSETLVTYLLESKKAVVPDIRYWTSKLALHVISSGFFNKRLEWADQGTAHEVPSNHQLSLDKALFMMLDRLAIIFMTPRALLGKLPGRAFREAYLSYTEMTKYLEELQDGAVDDIEEVANKRDKTILEAIVVSAADPEITGKTPLSKESVTGNIFFTLLAGHETTGSTLGFACTLLAIYPEYQKRIQDQLDRQLGDRPEYEWTVEKDFLPLQRGYLGAVQKEVLYLYNPASFIMRKTTEPVVLTDSNGKSHEMPPNILTLINNAAAARNPHSWKRPKVSAQRRAALSDSPALYLNPNRWLGTDDKPDEIKSKENELPNWSPFAAGGRACPGRAFAQIEMTSVMATLFKSYSLELVVDAVTLQKHGGDEQLAWEATRDKGIKMLYDDIKANISISLGKDLPIRIVPRTS